jgi:hypothetical protein
MSMMSSDSLFIDTDYDPTTATSTTTTTTTNISQEPWNKVQSSYAAKRKKMQAERMRQLKELEEQVTETANWNQRRKEIVTTSSRRPLVITSSEEFINSTTSSPTSTPSTSSSPTIIRSRQPSNSKVDLGDATLEDLEGLIAASAKRLASYRLRNHQRQDSNQNSPVPSSPTISQTQRKNEEMDRWKELLDSNSSNNSLNRLSTAKHYNSDLLIDNNTSIIATPLESGEKSPSASYLRLRNMFEKDNTTNTSLSSKAPQQPTTSSSRRSSTFSLAELANNRSTSNSNTSRNRKISTSSVNSTLDWKKKEHSHDFSGITTTRSTVSNATPKIEPPRISSSTTPRATSSHLRKATRSHSNHVVSPQQPSESTDSNITTRSRKLSTLASLQQRQRQNHHQIQQQKQNQEEKETDIKTVEDYMNSMIKKPSISTTSNSSSSSSTTKYAEEQPIVKRKVKLSITTATHPTNLSTTTARKVTNLKPLVNGSSTATATNVVRRKRGKVSFCIKKKGNVSFLLTISFIIIIKKRLYLVILQHHLLLYHCLYLL